MKLYEMFEKAIPGYQDANADHSKPVFKQSRKTKLTLKQIRKLRKMLDVRNYEKKENLKKIHDQYGPKAEAASTV
jgi:hypothetical protein